MQTHHFFMSISSNTVKTRSFKTNLYVFLLHSLVFVTLKSAYSEKRRTSFFLQYLRFSYRCCLRGKSCGLYAVSTGKQLPISEACKWRHRDPSKRRDLLALRPSIEPQKNGVFIPKYILMWLQKQIHLKSWRYYRNPFNKVLYWVSTQKWPKINGPVIKRKTQEIIVLVDLRESKFEGCVKPLCYITVRGVCKASLLRYRTGELCTQTKLRSCKSDSIASRWKVMKPGLESKERRVQKKATESTIYKIRRGGASCICNPWKAHCDATKVTDCKVSDRGFQADLLLFNLNV